MPRPPHAPTGIVHCARVCPTPPRADRRRRASQGPGVIAAHRLLSSAQRFNVAISRAKMLLVVVGDPNALWEDVYWRKLLQYAVDNGAYRGCPQPLVPGGLPDEDLDWQRRFNQLARSTLGAGKLGKGAFSSWFKGDNDVWGGDYAETDDQPWRILS